MFCILWLLLLTVLHLVGFPSAEARPQSIKVVMDNNYPPYVFYDSTGKLQGILIDQWRMWEQKTGISVDIHAMDWGMAISGMKASEFDVIDTIFKTEERSGWLDFSRPYADIEVPIFFDKNISGITDAASLKGFPVATKTGDAAVDLLKRNGVDNLMLFNSYEAIILAAKEHKVSVFVVDAPPALYFLYKFGIYDHYKQSAPLNIGQFHRAVKKGNSDLLKIVEDGFKQIPADELKKIETKWYGTALYDSRLPRYLLIIVGSLALLTLIIFAWNRVLRKTVATRTAELKTSLKELQTLSIRQDAILSAVPDIIMEVDSNKVYTWANCAGLEFFGEDVFGKEAASYFEGEQNTYDAIQPLFEGTVKVLYVESWQKRKDGEKRLLAWWCKGLKDDQGNVTGAISTAKDITERKLAEDALIESKNYLDKIINSIGDPIFVKDRRHCWVLLNDALCDFMGYALNELLGKSDYDFFPKNEADVFWSKDETVFATGVENINEEQFTDAKGAVHTIVTKKTLYVDKKGEQYIVGIIRDITEHKKLEEQLSQAAKMEAIGTLAGGVAHDFNNLLMGIQGRVSLISMDLETYHPLLEHIQAIEEYIRSATNLTKQLLGFARGGKYEVKPIDLNELVLDSSAMFGRTKKEIRIHTKCQTSPLVVEADRGQIEQVLLNMYINAWQAMPPDGGELYLETKISTLDEAYCKPHQVEPGNYVIISITDTGAGMDEATRQRIFDPFFTTKGKKRGTGLGLASAYGIIKNHGGMITVYSEIGRGTTFNIYLPVSDSEAHRELPLEEGIIKGSATILLVDDEQMIIEVGQAMLERLGYLVVVCRDGQEAVNVITDIGKKIDLVILDMIMPGMDGGTTFDRIREIQPDMPVILSSGYAINGHADKIMRRGCNGFIQKPYNISDLSQKISKVLDEAKCTDR
jgi:PAS domain S-box-containing protein